MNQISVYAAVTDRCYHFGLTNDEKERVAIPADNKNVDHGGTRRSGHVGISSGPGTWKQNARRHELPNIVKEGTHDTQL